MRHVRTALLLLLLAPALAWADKPDEKKAALDKQVRELEKEIATARGLDFQTPVKYEFIPRPKDASPKLQGYYDTKKKGLFVYDDVKENYGKGVLIHEMAHALQDQHFGLSKLHATTFGDDAELALAALIEGDAQLTMIETMKIAPEIRARMINTKLDKSQNLQNAFLYGAGTAYVQALKKNGGWRAVNDRLLFYPPRSTAEILHPDERIVPLNLGPGKTFGEFGLIRLFHANEKTRPDCMTAAAGWRGDRVIDDHGGTAWLVVFAKEEQAATFQKTLTELRGAEQPKLKTTTEGEATVWTLSKGRRAILRRGSHMVEVTAPDEQAHGLVDRAFGPPKLEAYSAADKKMLTFGELTDRLLDASVVCVGEDHNNELHHQVQLMVIKALYARDDRLGVGMEMFQRPYQKSLDRYVGGAIDEATMLEDTQYKSRWRWDWAFYKPIVDFCKRNQVLVGALNVSDELRERFRKAGGLDKLSDADKEDLGEIDFAVKKHRDYWFDKFGKMHGHGEVSKDEKERYYRAMTLWDGYMANSAVKFLTERKLRRVVVLAGSGHVNHNFGIPDRAARGLKKGGDKAVSVYLHVGGDLEKVKKDPPADFVLIVR